MTPMAPTELNPSLIPSNFFSHFSSNTTEIFFSAKVMGCYQFQAIPQFKKVRFKATNIFCYTIPTVWAAPEKMQEFPWTRAA